MDLTVDSNSTSPDLRDNDIDDELNVDSNKRTCEVGDVVAAKVGDFTILGDRFRHYVRGTIVSKVSRGSLKGYDVKLFEPEDFECYVPHPLNTPNYTQPSALNKFNWMDLIFVNSDDIVRHCPKSKVKTITFREGLKAIWSEFVFREVKTVIKQQSDLLDVEYVYLSKSQGDLWNGGSVDTDGLVKEKKFPSLKEAFTAVPKTFHRNIRGKYRNYYGFTTSSTVRDNDPYGGGEIFFSKKCHSELNLGFEPTGRFSRLHSELTWPPRSGQLICGLVEKGEKGLFYRKWFVCSRQFLTLWTMICCANHPSFKTLNSDQTKSFKQMLVELDTSALQPFKVCGNDKTSLSLKERQDKLRIFNVEYSASQWSDRYQELAQLCFPNSTSNSNISTGNNTNTTTHDSFDTRNFKELITKEILWMIK